MASGFSVPDVQMCLLDIEKLSSPNIWTTAKRAARSKKKQFFSIIFSLKLRLWVHQKMINSELAACFAVADVQICLLDTNMISSPNIRTIAKLAASAIEKSNLWSIIFVLKLELWVILSLWKWFFWRLSLWKWYPQIKMKLYDE